MKTQINKKVKAFTLSEMIIVLILTSIVIGIAFSVLQLVQKQMFAIQGNYNKSTELNKLETALWLDFTNFSKITYKTFENQLMLKNEIDSIYYTFSEETIIRGKDTFSIPLEDKKFFFDGLPSNGNKIDAIKLKTAKAYKHRELFIFKKNDATTYMSNGISIR